MSIIDQEMMWTRSTSPLSVLASFQKRLPHHQCSVEHKAKGIEFWAFTKQSVARLYMSYRTAAYYSPETLGYLMATRVPKALVAIK